MGPIGYLFLKMHENPIYLRKTSVMRPKVFLFAGVLLAAWFYSQSAQAEVPASQENSAAPQLPAEGPDIVAEPVPPFPTLESINDFSASIVTTPICGDGIIISPEECDDKNRIDGDGCSKECLVESKLENEQCSIRIVGGGVFLVGKVGTANGQTLCSSPAGERETEANPASAFLDRITGVKNAYAADEEETVVPVTTQCYTWTLVSGDVSECTVNEQCRDISVSCPRPTRQKIVYTAELVAKGGAFKGRKFLSDVVTFEFISEDCENGIKDEGEECDDGNNLNGDGCSAACFKEPPPSVCGNGRTETPEECDDGNKVDGDRCSSLCKVTPRCGDGSLDSGEQCDDGNELNGDSCSVHCTVEPMCGNGKSDPGEECDDGGLTSGDGCSSSCVLENPCGNGILDSDEQCDDHNNTNGDSCSSTCRKECSASQPFCAVTGECQPVDRCTCRINAECDDRNACTSESCVGGACIYSNNNLICDDRNGCTQEDRCNNGTCAGRPVQCLVSGMVCNAASGTCQCPTGKKRCRDACVFIGENCSCESAEDCQDHDVCNGREICSGHQCQLGPIANCNDGNLCTTDDCDPTRGCQHADNRIPCNDNVQCTIGDTCQAGGCEGQQNCVITNQSCSLASGQCECPTGQKLCSGANGSSCIPADRVCACTSDGQCNDRNRCNGEETCVNLQCVSGTALNCDDGNLCTSDGCSAQTGCVHENNPSICDDQNPCTVDECTDGACTGTPFECPAQGQIRVQSSDGQNCLCQCPQGTKQCGGQCIPNANFCCQDPNTKACQGSCIPTAQVCCTADADCPAETDLCYGAPTCNRETGSCIRGSLKDCDDRNVCTTDSCTAASGACVHQNNTATCDDGLSCTSTDACANGTCQGPSQCPAEEICTTAGCVCSEGQTRCGGQTCIPIGDCHCTQDADCNVENNICNGTSGDARCVSGTCIPGAIPSCDDQNGCTTDSCNPASGCVHSNNTQLCNDQNVCTANDICSQGQCGGTAIACPLTGQVCDAVQGCACPQGTKVCGSQCIPENQICCGSGTKRCQNQCIPLADCCTNSDCPEDTDVCNGHESCNLGTRRCQSGPALNCNDLNNCTTDTCLPLTGCRNAPNNNVCDDGDPCTINTVCSNGSCAGQPACAAGLVCDPSGPSCNCPAGQRLCGPSCISSASACECFLPGACNDNNACTSEETCDLVNHVCVNGTPVNCDDGNPCTNDDCSASVGCRHQSNNIACNDSNVCTQNDVCSNSICSGQTVSCPLQGQVCNPVTGCQCPSGKEPCGQECVTIGQCRCESDANCDDGNRCNGVEICDTGAHLCKIDPAQPAIVCDSGNTCMNMVCVTSSGQCVGQPLTGGSCNDQSNCTTNDICINGQCVGRALCPSGQNCSDGVCGCPDGQFLCRNSVCLPNGTPCDCVNSSQCPNTNLCEGVRTCVNFQCVSGTPVNCDDGLFCNGAESCNPLTGLCGAGTPPDCSESPDVSCTDDSCSDQLSRCVHTPLDNRCSGEKVCDAAQGCQCPANLSVFCGGHCVSDESQCPCPDDGIACTGEVFTGGECTHPPLDSRCSNGVFCDGSEICNAQTGCQSDAPPCSADLCNETSDNCADEAVEIDEVTGGREEIGPDVGTEPEPEPEEPPVEQTDEDLCPTGQVQCDGTCVECCGDADCQESPDNICTTNRCDMQEHRCLAPVNNTLSCASDNIACTNDICSGGSCTHPILPSGTPCDDGETVLCTVDTCDGTDTDAACQHQPDDSFCAAGQQCSTTTGCGCPANTPVSCDGQCRECCDDSHCGQGATCITAQHICI